MAGILNYSGKVTIQWDKYVYDVVFSGLNHLKEVTQGKRRDIHHVIRIYRALSGRYLHNGQKQAPGLSVPIEPKKNKSKIPHKTDRFHLQNRNRLTKNRLIAAKGEGGGNGLDWEIGVGRCKLLHWEWISKEVLSYSTGRYIQCLGIEHDGR